MFLCVLGGGGGGGSMSRLQLSLPNKGIPNLHCHLTFEIMPILLLPIVIILILIARRQQPTSIFLCHI